MRAPAIAAAAGIAMLARAASGAGSALTDRQRRVVALAAPLLVAAILLPTAVHILSDAPVIFAIVHWGTALTVEAFTAVVAMSAAVEVALAWFVWRLFRRG